MYNLALYTGKILCLDPKGPSVDEWIVLPAFLPVKRPSLLTVATAGSEDVQRIVLSVALSGLIVAVSWVPFPAGSIRR